MKQQPKGIYRHYRTRRARLLLAAVLTFLGASALADVIREDTATQVAIGPFLDGTDGVTAQTALTVTEFDCDLIKHANSGMTNTALTITASAGSNDAAHVTSGMYSLELTATDTNTAGRLILICDHATPATFMPVRHEWMVMPTQEYDSLYGTDTLQVHAVEMSAGLITATVMATDSITSDELAASALAEINTEVDGSMVTYGLDHLVSASVTGTDVTDNSILARMVSSSATADWDTFVQTTDSLQAVRDQLDITDGVVDNNATYLTNNLGTAGAAATEAGGNGDHLTEAGGTGDHLTAQPWNAAYDAEVQSEVTDALNAYDPPTNTEMTTAIDALPTAAENATEHLTQQRVLTGTCDSGSTTTCVDDALTQASTSQLDDRLICFSDSWCALITDFTPGTDTVTTTKVAPSTRSTLGYTIFPATAQ